MGKIEKGYIEQAARRGQEMPEVVANAPSLHLGLGFYYAAFWELLPSNQNGIIPWHIINAYGQYHRLDYEEMEELQHYMLGMCSKYREITEPTK